MNRTRPAMHAALRGVETPHVIKAAFAMMGVAEDVIADAKRRAGIPCPADGRARVSAEDASPLRGVFAVLEVPPAMLALAPRVYESHARELVERMLRRADLAPATDAELLVALAAASLDGMPTALDGQIHEALFFAVMGPGAAGLSPRGDVEPWSGARAERVAELRRQLRSSNRTGHVYPPPQRRRA